MRVHELAKELGIQSQALLDKLNAMGVKTANRLSAVEAEVAARLRAEAQTAAAKPEIPKGEVSKPPAKKAPAAPGKEAAPAAAKPAKTRKKEAVEPPPVPAKAPPPPKKPTTPVAAPKPPPPAVAAKPAPAQAAPPPPKVLTLKSTIVVKDLAEEMGMRPNQLIADLMLMNVLASINERLDPKVAQKIAEKHGFTVEREKKIEARPTPPKEVPEESDETDRPEDIVLRPPVVTILGHVDHGKTSLLDKIRHTAVAKGEAGGITQHIGASTVIAKGKRITFLDTPGHEAFTAMRARGAHLTDIAVIVIAADDGVMPQTKEAIKHAQAAEVPIMVAINKCDLPAANPTKVKQQLAAEGLTTEDWGGTTICCEVSATTGKGLDHLLDMILLQAEMQELKANPERRASGYVIEARLEPGMGPTANLLVLNGTLHVGDIILCGQYCGRVRALMDDHGKKCVATGPATPVQCLGLPGVPEAGAEFKVCNNEREARAIAEQRQSQNRVEQRIVPKRMSLDSFLQQAQTVEKPELRIILKTDVQGSLEAIEHSLREIKSEKVTLNILMSGVGNITTNDVLLASASNAIVIGFHIALEDGVARLAKQEGVEIRLQSIIYEITDAVRDALTGMLAPTIKEKVVGHALIKQVFEVSRGGSVAGCQVTHGSVTPKHKVRVKRQNDVIYQGAIASLRRFQNDASEVREGQECGIRLDNFTGYAAGDLLEFYVVEKIAQTL